VARHLAADTGVIVRNALSYAILAGHCVKAPYPGQADYTDRMRSLESLSGFFVYLLLSIA